MMLFSHWLFWLKNCRFSKNSFKGLLCPYPRLFLLLFFLEWSWLNLQKYRCYMLYTRKTQFTAFLNLCFVTVGHFSRNKSHLLSYEQGFCKSSINCSVLVTNLTGCFSFRGTGVFRANEWSALLLSVPAEKYSIPCNENCDLKRPFYYFQIFLNFPVPCNENCDLKRPFY